MRRTNDIAVLAALALAGTACSEDPIGPPIPEDSFRLELRNWFNTDPIRGANEGLIEFEVVVEGVGEAAVAEIEAMAVRFPARAPKIPIPVAFELREDGALSARTYYDRGTAGLSIGDDTLEVEFVTGDTVTIVTYAGQMTLGPPQILEVTSTVGSAGVRWRAPGSAHQWRVTLERFDAGTETVIAEGAAGSSGGGGTFSIGYDFTREPDAVYGLVIYMTSSGNYRRFVVPV